MGCGMEWYMLLNPAPEDWNGSLDAAIAAAAADDIEEGIAEAATEELGVELPPFPPPMEPPVGVTDPGTGDSKSSWLFPFKLK